MRGVCLMNPIDEKDKINITYEICNKQATFTKQGIKNGNNLAKMLAEIKKKQSNIKNEKE